MTVVEVLPPVVDIIQQLRGRANLLQRFFQRRKRGTLQDEVRASAGSPIIGDRDERLDQTAPLPASSTFQR